MCDDEIDPWRQDEINSAAEDERAEEMRQAMSSEYARGVTDGWNLAFDTIAKGEAIERAPSPDEIRMMDEHVAETQARRERGEPD